MKKNQITCLTLATALLVSSCTSSYQAAGGATGAMIGSHVGGAIGALSGHGHFRGESAALGSLIGMGIGAILGVGITSQIEEQERAEARRYEGYGQVNTRNDGGYYDNNVGYQTSGGYQGGQNVQSNHNYQIGNGSYDGAIASTVLSISELSYMDADGDGYISKDETIEVEGFITNTSNSVLRDIVIYVFTESGVSRYDAGANALVPVLSGDRRGETGKQPFAANASVDLVYVQDRSCWSRTKTPPLTILEPIPTRTKTNPRMKARDSLWECEVTK